MKFLIRFVILSLSLSAAFLPINMYAQIDPPKIIQPSPSVSQLLKYIDYPIDYSTGVPSVQIPLYEVKSGSLSLPISLSYHAGGRKVYDQDNGMALGWILNAGGNPPGNPLDAG